MNPFTCALCCCCCCCHGNQECQKTNSFLRGEAMNTFCCRCNLQPTLTSMSSHLAYQPLLPSGNKYLQKKWDQMCYDIHRTKLKTMKPTVDNTAPKTYDHPKTLKCEDHWTMKIEKENRLLLDKISHIMKTNGRVDNRNYYEKKSLGLEKRQRELVRITKENQEILLRLNRCRSQYDVRNWHQDWLKTLRVMDAIARYPRGRESLQKEKASKRRDNNDTTTDEAKAQHHYIVDDETKTKEKEMRMKTTIKEDTGGDGWCSDGKQSAKRASCFYR
ncbi:sperm axonemal maintenance protein CFAP97D1-like isoform X2 [Entelurus aequoreus]|uniref:sperm axonemal maintenance protein CFAP97D1-like isoform X2 n=1 Tax=Entelurus aequoreus TaxID=161455 RepID=UPI002B1D7E53|nr:sperm axonemal maintenance protein CFAP97D1-like isoform X2 [Entelurus aequoreus]